MNDIFKALADSTRRKIISLLNERDMTAGEIAQAFDISKPSISHHLNLLKKAEILIDQRKGQYIYYSLNASIFQDIIGWFSQLNQKD